MIYARGRNLHATYLPLWWLQIQNELLRTMMALAVIWFPVFAVTHSGTSGVGRWGNAMFAASSVLILAVPLYRLASHRMLEHSYEQRKIRFNARYRTMRPSSNLGLILIESVGLVGQYYEWFKANHQPAGTRRSRISEEGFVRALSANLALQILIRTALIITTVVGFAIIMVSVLLPVSESSQGSATR